MKCIIVDDEALARKLLESYVAKIPELHLVKKCENALQALKVLEQEAIDLMLLDIHMPDLSGIDLLKSLNKKPLTILTTAYSDYALEGYQLDVIDYLLKPIAFERFLKAINKSRDYLQLSANQAESGPVPDTQEKSTLVSKEYFYVKADYKIIRVDYEEMLYVEGLREYVRLHTQDQKIITLLSLNKLMEFLPNDRFFRIHRSYIINLDKIKEIQGNMVLVGEQALTVSKGYKEAFFQRIEQLGLY